MNPRDGLLLTSGELQKLSAEQKGKDFASEVARRVFKLSEQPGTLYDAKFADFINQHQEVTKNENFKELLRLRYLAFAEIEATKKRGEQYQAYQKFLREKFSGVELPKYKDRDILSFSDDVLENAAMKSFSEYNGQYIVQLLTFSNKTSLIESFKNLMKSVLGFLKLDVSEQESKLASPPDEVVERKASGQPAGGSEAKEGLDIEEDEIIVDKEVEGGNEEDLKEEVSEDEELEAIKLYYAIYRESKSILKPKDLHDIEELLHKEEDKTKYLHILMSTVLALYRLVLADRIGDDGLITTMISLLPDEASQEVANALKDSLISDDVDEASQIRAMNDMILVLIQGDVTPLDIHQAWEVEIAERRRISPEQALEEQKNNSFLFNKVVDELKKNVELKSVSNKDKKDRSHPYIHRQSASYIDVALNQAAEKLASDASFQEKIREFDKQEEESNAEAWDTQDSYDRQSKVADKDPGPSHDIDDLSAGQSHEVDSGSGLSSEPEPVESDEEMALRFQREEEEEFKQKRQQQEASDRLTAIELQLHYHDKWRKDSFKLGHIANPQEKDALATDIQGELLHRSLYERMHTFTIAMGAHIREKQIYSDKEWIKSPITNEDITNAIGYVASIIPLMDALEKKLQEGGAKEKVKELNKDLAFLRHLSTTLNDKTISDDVVVASLRNALARVEAHIPEDILHPKPSPQRLGLSRK